MLLRAADFDSLPGVSPVPRARPPADARVHRRRLARRRRTARSSAFSGRTDRARPRCCGCCRARLKPQTGRVRARRRAICARSARGARAAASPSCRRRRTLAFDYTVLEIVLMGRYPHLGAFEVEGPRRSGRGRRRARGDRHASARRSRVPHAQRRRKAARVIASALAQTRRTRRTAPSRRCSCSTSRRRRSICAISSRSARSCSSAARQDRGITVAAVDARPALRARRSARRSSCSPAAACSRAGRRRTMLTPARVGALYGIDPELVAPQSLATAGRVTADDRASALRRGLPVVGARRR